jgi:hypothetical protein
VTSELYSPAPNGLELTFHTDSAALAEDEFSQACENLSIGCSNSARSGATDIVALSALIGSDKFPVGDCLAWQVALRQSLPPLHRPETIFVGNQRSCTVIFRRVWSVTFLTEPTRSAILIVAQQNLQSRRRNIGAPLTIIEVLAF